ncbi:glycosyltransferase family 4 protein [bacterium]|nr:glycosyltransferase family 4 protein [bacterium]
MRTRIAMLGAFPPAIGGISACIDNLMRSGLRHRHAFLPFHTYSRKGGSAAYGEESVLWKTGRVLSDMARFIPFLVRRAPNLVHVHTSFGDWSFWRDSLYVLLARAAGKPVFLQIHGGDLASFMRRHPSAGSLPRILLSFPTRIGVLSRMQEIPLRLLSRRNGIERVPNFVKAGETVPRKEIRSRFGIPQRSCLAVFAAPHLYPAKGVFELMGAAAALLPSYPELRFCVIGGGGAESALRRIRKSMRGGERVLFTGNISPETVRQWMSAADIFILPSHGEGFPMSVLEAMAAGLPVTATRVGAVPEMIDDGIGGILIPPRDSEALARALAGLIENPSVRKRMGLYNREKVLRMYSMKNAEKTFGRCYRITAGLDR